MINETVMNELLKRLNGLREDVAYLQRAPAIPSVIATWTPAALTGFSAAPTGGIYRYVLLDHLCCCFVTMPNTGTSNATTFTLSAPLTAATATGALWQAAARITDNGVAAAAPGLVTIASAGTVFTVYKDFALGAWTASGAKSANFTLIYETA